MNCKPVSSLVEIFSIFVFFFFNFSIRPFDDLVYEDCYDNEDSDDKYDSEDSNEENYFANDYPDEDDEMVCNSSQSEDGYDNENFENLTTAMNNFVFGKEIRVYRKI